MKVAVCFSGCVRTMPDLIKNHRENLLDLYDCDVYFSLWDHWGIHHHRDTSFVPEKQKISEYWKNKLVESYKPVVWEFEDYSTKKPQFVLDAELYQESPDPGDINVFSMYYKIQRCYSLVESTGKQYDIVLRIRPDIKFESKIIFTNPRNDTVYSCLRGDRTGNGWGSNDQICYGSQETMRKQCKMYENIPILKKQCLLPGLISPEVGVRRSYDREKLEEINDVNINYNLCPVNSYPYFKEKLHVIFNTYEKNLPIVDLSLKYFCKHNAPNMFNVSVISNRFPENKKIERYDKKWDVNFISGDINMCSSGTHFGPTLKKALDVIQEEYIMFYCDDYILTSHIDHVKLNTLLHMMEKEHIDLFIFASSEPERFGFEPYKVKDIYDIDKDKLFVMPQSFRHAYSVQPCIWRKSALQEVLKYNPNLTLHALDNSSIADKSGYYRSFKKDEFIWYEPWPNPEHEYKFNILCTNCKIFDLCCPPEKFIISYREVTRYGKFHIEENGYGGIGGYHGQTFIKELIEIERLESDPEYARYLPDKNDKAGANT